MAMGSLPSSLHTFFFVNPDTFFSSFLQAGIPIRVCEFYNTVNFFFMFLPINSVTRFLPAQFLPTQEERSPGGRQKKNMISRERSGL